MGSLIYKQDSLKLHLRFIINTLKCITDQRYSIKNEIACWQELSIALRDSSIFNDAIKELKEEKIISEETLEKAYLYSKVFGTDFVTLFGYASIYNAWGRGIQQHIVLEFLKGNIK